MNRVIFKKFLISTLSTSGALAAVAVVATWTPGCGDFNCLEGDLLDSYEQGTAEAAAEMDQLYNEGRAKGLLDYGPTHFTAAHGEDYGTNKGRNDGYHKGFNDPDEGILGGYDDGYAAGVAYANSGPNASNGGAVNGDKDGHSDGIFAGRADGFQDGYNDGYDVGYVEGQESCLSEASPEQQNQCFTQGYDSVYVGGKYDEGYTAGRIERLDGNGTLDNTVYLTAYNTAYATAYTLGIAEGKDVGYQYGYDLAYELGYETTYDQTFAKYYDLHYPIGFDRGYDQGYNDLTQGYGSAPEKTGGFGAGYTEGLQDGKATCLASASDAPTGTHWGKSPAWTRAHLELNPDEAVFEKDGGGTEIRRLKRPTTEILSKRLLDAKDGVESLRETLRKHKSLEIIGF
jgi:hypothetical protein